MPESAKQTKQIGNELLAAMPRLEFEPLYPHLEPVTLQHGKILYDLHDPVQHAHFITGGMISMLLITEAGQSVEVTMVGPEGRLGVRIVLTTP